MSVLFRDLKVRLTDHEWAAAAEEMAATQARIDSLTEEKKQSSADFKARIDQLVLNASKLGLKVRSHEEERPVECRERPDDRRFCVEIVRQDTLEIVDTRPMTTGERNKILNPTLPGVVADTNGPSTRGADWEAPFVPPDGAPPPEAASAAAELDQEDAELEDMWDDTDVGEGETSGAPLEAAPDAAPAPAAPSPAHPHPADCVCYYCRQPTPALTSDYATGLDDEPEAEPSAVETVDPGKPKRASRKKKNGTTTTAE